MRQICTYRLSEHPSFSVWSPTLPESEHNGVRLPFFTRSNLHRYADTLSMSVAKTRENFILLIAEGDQDWDLGLCVRGWQRWTDHVAAFNARFYRFQTANTIYLPPLFLRITSHPSAYMAISSTQSLFRNMICKLIL
jgi:hypothetical protein